MAKTPDRAPGASDEEATVYEPSALSTTQGEVRYDGTRFSMYDSVGEFDPRNVATAFTTMLVWGADSVSNSTTTRYLAPYYDDGLAETSAIQYRLTSSCSISKMRVRHNLVGGSGNSIVYTLRINNVATALTVSLAASALDGSDLVNSVAASAGDLVDIEITKALSLGGGGGPNNITLVAELV